MSGILDTRLRTQLARLFDDLVTIQANGGTRDTVGQKTASWANLADHVALACRFTRARDDEAKGADQLITSRTHRLVLRGLYPTITTAHRALVTTSAGETLTLDIIGAESDSGDGFTYLDLELVT